jgi:hypothetical protein
MCFVWMAGAVASLIVYLFIYNWRSLGIIVPLGIAIMTLLSFGAFDGLLRYAKGPPDEEEWQNGVINWPIFWARIKKGSGL